MLWSKWLRAEPERSGNVKPKVLFLCTGNSARSQMAEGYLRHIAGDRYEPLSAGTEPKGLNPLAVEAMQELGIDISQQRSKDVAKLLDSDITYLVTVCDNAREKCPIFPGPHKSLHWNLEDPAAVPGNDQQMAVFRRVRDEIVRRIQHEFLPESVTRRG